MSTRAASRPTLGLGLLTLALLAGCGQEVPPPKPARVPYRALAVTTGRAQTCALLDDHRVKCWGDNAEGELGLGDTRTRGESASEMGYALPAIDVGLGRTVAAISAARYHTCALLDDGSVKCWGMRAFCGYGADPVNPNIGDGPGEMGDALPALDLGPGHIARLLAAGYTFSCAILDDDTARCWGAQPDMTVPTPVPLTPGARVVALAPGGHGALALRADGTIQDLTPPTGAAPLIPNGAGAISIAGSERNRCAVLNDGALYCGEGHPLTKAFAPLRASGRRLVAAGTAEIDGACGLVDDGGVRCFRSPQECTPAWCDASPADGLLGVRLGQPALAISTGGNIFCALLASGAVRCWGQPYGLPNAALGSSFDSLGIFQDVDLGSRDVSTR